MQSQYTTKDTSAIKNAVDVICRNLAPLLGCKVGGKGWSPFVGYTICSELKVAGTMCSNVSNKMVTNDVLTYKFNSALTTGISKIWSKALEYDPQVLNSSYIMYVSSKMPVGSQITEKLHLTSKFCRYTDSTLFDAIFDNEQIALTPLYLQIFHIMLSCFAIRYMLFEYVSGVNDLDTTEVNSKVIGIIVENIDYVKFNLGQNKSVASEYSKSYDYVSQHLSTLRKNLMMIEPNILQYFR